MKMVRAIIRPDKGFEVASALAKANFPALTKWDVLIGRPRPRQTTGCPSGRPALRRTCQDHDADRGRRRPGWIVISTIQEVAFTSYPRDGKIFVTPVESAYTIRTGKPDL